MILEQMKTLVVGGPGDKRKIFASKPHSTWDNYFSGDKILNYMGKNGFAGTMTCRCDRLPVGVPKSAFHHAKNPSTLETRWLDFCIP